ncbi:MAG: SpoVG family protein [Candidatus Aureabacteria bacterium]|nr:SpoVG family protein [Candidatus Auribacterota bacterium]
MVQITEVRLSRRNSKDGKLKAFATITFDNQFVIRDLKIIDGKKGLFVAMPSKKIYDSCPKCGKKNPIRNNFCGKCGARLNPKRMDRREEHRDIAHPINSQTRDYIQDIVIGEYKKIAEQIESGASDSGESRRHEDFDKISAFVDDDEIEEDSGKEPELADRLDI